MTVINVELVGGPLDGKTITVTDPPFRLLVHRWRGYVYVYEARRDGKYQFVELRKDPNWPEEEDHCSECGSLLSAAVRATVALGGPRVCGPCIDKRYA